MEAENTESASADGPDVGVLRACVVVVMLSLVAHTLLGVSAGYSYWYDELFSVAFAGLDFGAALRTSLNDVHPPLYNGMLWLWVRVVGTSELALRSLSAVAVLGTLPALWTLREKLPTTLTSLFALAFLSNWLVFYYAQEVRSYAFVLLFSTWTFVSWARCRFRAAAGFAVLLGCTHFFGTLQALFYLGLLGLESRKDARRVMCASFSAVLILVFPAVYVLMGNASQVSGGSFWIDSSPLDALRQAFRAAVPPVFFAARWISDRFTAGRYYDVFGLVGLASLGALCLVGARELNGSSRRIVVGALITSAGPVVCGALLNLHTPVTTIRNFIILVPAGALVTAISLRGLAALIRVRVVASTAVVCAALVGHLDVERTMKERYRPHEDWANVSAEVLRVARAQELDVLILDHQGAPEDPFRRAMLGHYLGASVGFETTSLDLALASGDDTVVMFGHLSPENSEGEPCENALTLALAGAGRSFDRFFVEQTNTCRNGYVVVHGESGVR